MADTATRILLLLSAAAMIFIVLLLVDGVRTLLVRREKERASRVLDLVVSARSEHAGKLVRLTLARADGDRLPGFAAGQYVSLRVPAGKAGKPLQRAYSLAAWSRRPRQYELGIKREERGVVSGWIWEALHIGQRITLQPPKGDFVLASDDQQALLLIGGGIGITPMRAMLHAALAGKHQRPVVLLHAARSESELLYLDEFRQLATQNTTFHYLPLVSRPSPDWSGAVGRIDAARALAALSAREIAATDVAIFLCAGDAMMTALRTGFAAAGIAPGQIHWEAFGIAAGGSSSGQQVTVVGGHAGGGTFVTAAEPTLLAALENHDLAPVADCRAGTCGECRMRLLTGEVRWLAEAGLPLRQDEILPCVCAAAGNISVAAS